MTTRDLSRDAVTKLAAAAAISLCALGIAACSDYNSIAGYPSPSEVSVGTADPPQRTLRAYPGYPSVFRTPTPIRRSNRSPSVQSEPDGTRGDTASAPTVSTLADDDGPPPRAEKPTPQRLSLTVVGKLDRDCHDLHLVDRLLYAACGSNLVVFDIMNPVAPQELGAYEHEHEVFEVTATETHAYLFDVYGRLLVDDVGDPADIRAVSVTSPPVGIARETAIVDDILFVAGAAGAEHVPGGLSLIDIDDPAAPVRVGHYALPDEWDWPNAAEGRDLVVDGGLVYLAVSLPRGQGALHVLDVSTPAAPRLVSSLDPGGSVKSLALNGDLTYLNVDGSDEPGLAELQAYNMAGTQAPILLGAFTYDDPAAALGDPTFSSGHGASLRDIVNVGSVVFSVDSHYGTNDNDFNKRHRNALRAIDLGDPAFPVGVASLEIVADNPADIEVSSGYLYVASGESGILIVEVTDG